MKESKKICNLIGFFFLAMFLSLLIGNLILNNIFSMTCDYHPPISKTPSLFFNAFYDLEGGMHPTPSKFNWVLWMILGMPFGFMLYRLKRIFNKKAAF